MSGMAKRKINSEILRSSFWCFLSQFSAKVLKLARKQRMNTEVRRNIFCVIMTSEDYLDAFEKLIRFVLKLICTLAQEEAPLRVVSPTEAAAS